MADVAGGSLYVGSVETVATKIARTVRTLDVGRFDMVYSAAGTVSSSARLRSVELYGAQVIPRVRKLLGERPLPKHETDCADPSPIPRDSDRGPNPFDVPSVVPLAGTPSEWRAQLQMAVRR